jgi:Ca-activated chloride channel homolog
MRLSGRILAVAVLAWCVQLGAQSSAPGGAGSASTIAPSIASVPPGENVVLELKSPLNSKTAHKGDLADFSTTSEVLVGTQVAIPRGTTVHATVTEAKRAGTLKKARLGLQFNEIVLADGTHKPLSADLMRSGFLQASGERSKAQIARTVVITAVPSIIVGGIFGGALGAAQGAALGAALGGVAVLMQHGPDLDFPAGMQFEIELTKPLDVPLPHPQLAASPPPPSPPAGPVPTEDPKSVAPPSSQSGALPAGNPDANSGSKPAETATAAADRTVPPVPGASVNPAVPVTPNAGTPGGFMLKVDVNLVLVEATVRDERGQVVDNLKRENFRIYEDGTEQQIVQFSRDELPLAVALVLDRSGSMGPVLRQVRDAAFDTLSQLKRNDEVALFAFASTSKRLEDLTTDRQRIADDIAGIYAGGGTDITDALFDAALYLGRAAPNRRHAVILVSDNDGTVQGYSSEKDVIRMALETETSIYSIKVKAGGASRALSLPLALPNALPGTGSVPKMARETGGELIDTHTAGSVQSAMATVIARLKQRYTLGYSSTNRQRDGSFRQIDIRVSDGSTSTSVRYSVFARRGYYAPTEHAAAQPAQAATSK